MRKMIVFFMIVYLISGLMPAVMMSNATVNPDTPQTAEVFAENGESFDENTQITVNDYKTGQVCSMSFAEYLTGVLAAEMPAEFELEALKAQAICARTYALYKIALQEKYGEVYECHNGGQVCTNPDHCSAYFTKDEQKELWGENYVTYKEKISRAVSETDGLTAVYKQEPICAVFHSTYTDKTEDSKNVWGQEVDYLKSVENLGQELSPKYKTTVDFDIEEYENLILKEYPAAKFDEGNLISDIQKSDAGSILSLKTGGVTVTGSKIREVFDLPSLSFDVVADSKRVTFKVTGYGHGVGLNQYGAEYLAKEGYTCEEIIKWYYTGVMVEKFHAD